ncbi:MAG: hypothetical protein HY851_06180 [candidate division Zixibacteria bacterium]|nr:hypothetical protein [candidate division Zixibacteria bacterium]
MVGRTGGWHCGVLSLVGILVTLLGCSTERKAIGSPEAIAVLMRAGGLSSPQRWDVPLAIVYSDGSSLKLNTSHSYPPAYWRGQLEKRALGQLRRTINRVMVDSLEEKYYRAHDPVLDGEVYGLFLRTDLRITMRWLEQDVRPGDNSVPAELFDIRKILLDTSHRADEREWRPTAKELQFVEVGGRKINDTSQWPADWIVRDSFAFWRNPQLSVYCVELPASVADSVTGALGGMSGAAGTWLIRGDDYLHIVNSRFSFPDDRLWKSLWDRCQANAESHPRIAIPSNDPTSFQRDSQ